MSFMLWYSTQGTRVSVHAIAFWSTHMVDFFSFLVSASSPVALGR
jgi:hypothetical protein